MALVRWEPAREFASLQTEMNRLMNSFFDPANGGSNGPARRWMPAMDLVETDGAFVLKADLPGLSEDDVTVEVDGNVLTVKGERRAEHEDTREGYFRLERSFGSFARALTLPEGVDADKIEANFDKGVLEVRIPKPEEKKPRRIEIGGGQKTIEG